MQLHARAAVETAELLHDALIGFRMFFDEAQEIIAAEERNLAWMQRLGRNCGRRETAWWGFIIAVKSDPARATMAKRMGADVVVDYSRTSRPVTRSGGKIFLPRAIPTAFSGTPRQQKHVSASL